MAETTLCATGSRVDLLPVVTSFRRQRPEQGQAEPCAADEPQAARLVSSGITGGGLEVAIVDPDSLRRQPENVIGEIWISGPAVAKGYWRRPEETQATFEARIHGENGPYLRTGDLGFVRDGELYVSGRLKDMVIIRGMNVYPGAIEQILHSFPEVVEHRITARRRGELDELIVEVEDHLQQPERIAKELCLRLGLTIDVHAVSAMSLPRFEGKGARFIDDR